MYYFLTMTWLGVVIVGWHHAQQRRLPIILGILGCLGQVGFWFLGWGFFAVAFLGVLSLIGMVSVPDVFLREKS